MGSQTSLAKVSSARVVVGVTNDFQSVHRGVLPAARFVSCPAPELNSLETNSFEDLESCQPEYLGINGAQFIREHISWKSGIEIHWKTTRLEIFSFDSLSVGPSLLGYFAGMICVYDMNHIMSF